MGKNSFFNTSYLKGVIAYIFSNKAVVYTVLGMWAASTIFPILWIANNSLKTSKQIFMDSMSLAGSFNLGNFYSITNYSRIDKAFLNSMIISSSVVLLSLLFGGFAAFAIARFSFRYKGIVKLYIYASMLVPQFAIVLPVFWILRDMKVYGSHLALIIPQTASNISFAVVLLLGFMVTIPKELEEAALIEGCSIPAIFFKVILPVSKPAFATTAIMIFLWSYNDLLLSLIYLPQKNLQPICVILANISTVFGINYGAMMAGVLLTIIPVLIIYVISQEYVIGGIVAGVLKS